MFNTSIFEVVIGLVFVYLLLSLICTAAQEVIEAWLKKRAKDLEAGIRELLNDPQGTGLAKQVYEHPLIFGLYSGNYAPTTWKEFFRSWGRTNLPSYIPGSNFAVALLDVVLHPDRVPSTVKSDTPVSAPPPATPPPGTPSLPIREIIGQVENVQIRRALLALAEAAGDDENRLRAGVAAWFDSQMDRVSGWYKRWSEVVILLLGLALTIGLNVDTITIGAALAQDPQLRQQVVNAAEKYNEQQKQAEQEKKSQQIPGQAAETAPDVETARKKLQEELDRLSVLGLPIGWNANDPRVHPGINASGWASKIAGWLLTALAISLGSPFWFDLLNKFMIVRSTVKPIEKSPPEKPIS